MNRRQLLGLALSPWAGAAGPRKPKRLREGDTVALVTPSTEVIEPEQLRTAEETCEYFGLKAVRMPSVGRRQPGFDESVKSRVADLHEAFRHPRYSAVFCVRGGYGSQHMLARIDYELIGAHPKVVLSYSDITAMHLAIHQKTGLVTFHGPVPLSSFTPYTQEHFRKALFRSGPMGEVTNPAESNHLRPAHKLRTIRGGVARGRLIGGNLTMISTLLGTPYEIDTRGRILLIEDVGEQIYRLDRMLMHLKLAKKFEQAAGIVWGECSDCPPRDEKPSLASPYGPSEMVGNLLGDLAVPVVSGLVIGHTADQLTLPIGVEAVLDANRGVLRIVEAATE